MADNFTIVTPDGNRSIKSREDGSDHVQAVDVADVPGGLLTPGDSVSNPAGVSQFAAFPHMWDGTQWVRSGFPTGDITVLSSTVRTATAHGPALKTRGARGVTVLLDAIVKPSTGMDLEILVRTKIGDGPAVVRYIKPVPRATLDLINKFSFTLYPGIDPTDMGESGETISFAKNGTIGPTIQISILHSDTKQWQYGVKAVLHA